MKFPFENFNDLHAWRRVNCEGCDKWSCFVDCQIWVALNKSTRSPPISPTQKQAILDSGYTEGKKIWPCKQFKDYGYIGFVPGVGKKPKGAK